MPVFPEKMVLSHVYYAGGQLHCFPGCCDFDNLKSYAGLAESNDLLLAFTPPEPFSYFCENISVEGIALLLFDSNKTTLQNGASEVASLDKQ